MSYLNQSDFANHIGKNRSYVTQLKAAGRLVIVDGKVDVEASEALINATKDPSKKGVSDRHDQAKSNKEAEQQTDKDSSYQLARAMKEKYNAKQAKISYEKEVGLLLVAAEVKAAVADGDAIIRNRLESLPDVLAPQLAAELNEQHIRTILMDYIEQLLSDLSRTFNGMAK